MWSQCICSIRIQMLASISFVSSVGSFAIQFSERVCAFTHKSKHKPEHTQIQMHTRTHTLARLLVTHKEGIHLSRGVWWCVVFEGSHIKSNQHTEAAHFSEIESNENRNRLQQSQNEHSVDHVTHWNEPVILCAAVISFCCFGEREIWRSLSFSVFLLRVRLNKKTLVF